MKALLGISLLCGALCYSAPAQVAPPKTESRLHHLFFRHTDVGDLEQRYNSLRCAMVTISWKETMVSPSTAGQQQLVSITHFGTGFYTSPEGDVVTAAHVIGNKGWSDPGTGMVVSLATPAVWEIQNSDDVKQEISRDKLEQAPDAWGADLARIKTSSKPPCWLRTVDDESVRPGQHVVTLGFPALAFKSLTIYSGIVSARLKSDLMVGVTAQGAPVRSQNELLRVQLPLSPGLSGAAVVDDENRAVAVVSAAGASTTILDALIQLASIQELTFASPLPPGQSRNVDWPLAVGELAKTLREYASPGYGDTVPLSYLKAKTSATTGREPAPRDPPRIQDHPK